VAFAHSKGVIHRDLKPENVMIGPFGEVLVLDFGVAKLQGEAGPAGTLSASGPGTGHGTVVGTPGFMPPEQARGQAVDARADVYALGTLLHLMLTDRLPGDEGARASPRGLDRKVPRPLASILGKALAPEPERRYPGAHELGDDLSRYLSGLRVAAHREGIFERGVRVAAKYKTPIALIVAYMVMRIVLILVTGR
jgi:serine/threonine-protein kinase